MNTSIFNESLKYLRKFNMVITLAQWISHELTKIHFETTKILKTIENFDYETTILLLDYIKNETVSTNILLYIHNRDIIIPVDLLEALKRNRASISQCHRNGALTWAAKCGFLDLVKLLLENKAYCHFNNEKALENAINYKHQSIIDYLLNYDQFACYDDLLNEAAVNGNHGIVKALIDSNAKIYCYDRALRLSIQNHHDKVTNLLVNKGSFCFDRTDKLYEYVEKNDYTGIETLLNLGVNINLTGGIVLTIACDNDAYGNNIPMIKFLIEKGVNIHVKDDFALIMACQRNRFELVQLLLESGANIHARQNEALRTAIHENNKDIVKLLIKYGIDLHDYILDITILHTSRSMLKLLLKAGALISEQVFKLAQNTQFEQLINLYYSEQHAPEISRYIRI